MDFLNLRLNITAKLILMAGAVLLIAGSSLIYLAIEIRRSETVITTVLDEQGQYIERLGKIQAAGQSFGELRYWMTDLSVSWLDDSEEAADLAQEEFLTLIKALEADGLDGVAALEQPTAEFKEMMLDAVDAYVDGNRVIGNSRLSAGRQHVVTINEQLNTLIHQTQTELDDSSQRSATALIDNNSKLLLVSLLGLAMAILVGGLSCWLVARAITRPLALSVNVAESIAAGKLDNEISITSTDETGQLLAALKTMQQNLHERIEKEALDAAVNGRIRQALDNANMSIMIVNQDMQIIYINSAVQTLMASVEEDLKAELSDFSASALMGSSIKIFDSEAGAETTMEELLALTGSHDITLGGHTFNLQISSVMDEQQQRMGSVVEWSDRTQEVTTEAEVQDLVQKALQGDLSNRIDLLNKDGFFAQLGTGMNDLVTICEQVVQDTSQVLSGMASGDLSKRIDANYQGSFDQLKDNVNATVDRLKEVVDAIQSATGEVQQGSAEIVAGNDNLSRRTDEQAANLEETAASLEQITRTVKLNADNALEAAKLAAAAREIAESGGTVVNEAVTSMSEINAASERISDITGVIDEIAFQTNLLALNASVEAARAGEQGLGFAVVASEVRALAERSATAAKEISELIEDSVTKVSTGTKHVNESGEILQKIVLEVKKVSDLIGEISTASNEQAIGVEEVNLAMVNMDQMTHQNAELVTQSTATGERVSQSVEKLNEVLKFFSGDAVTSNAAANKVSPNSTLSG